MMLKVFRKQPSEYKDYDISFVPWLGAMGDTLDYIETVVECLTDPANTSLTVPVHKITATLVKLWIMGGTDSYTYKVTIKVFTVGGRVDESELIFAVDNI